MTFHEYRKNDTKKSEPVDVQGSTSLTFDELNNLSSDVDTLYGKTKSLESPLDDHFVSLMIFQMQLKVMHWGTDSYSQHKAYGKIYKEVDENLDSLVESYEGYHGRIDFGCSCEIPSFNNIEVESWLSSIIECLIYLKSELKEPDLQNIIDEIMASVSKLRYLLSLK